MLTHMDLPLERATLESCLAPFGTATALPSRAYTSPDVFTWEQEHLFAPSWICVGRAGVHRSAAGEREMGGWRFVQRDPSGPGFEEQFGNLFEHLAPWESERLVVGARHSYEIRANWKLIHENYQECYHCSEIHPELCKVSPPDSGYSLDIHGMFVAGPMDLRDGVETMSLDGRSYGIPLRGLDERQRHEVGYFGVWPNLLISPHPDYLLTHRIEPLAADRVYIECEWLFPPELVERADFDPSYAVDFWDVTNKEDWRACESLQRGVSSRGHRPGVFSTGWEAGVYLVTAMMARSYLEGRPTGYEHVPDAAKIPRYELLAAQRGGR
jgi:glycine betaine catabolism A